MISVKKNLLIAGLILIIGAPATAQDPDHFIVFDMPEDRMMQQFGRIPMEGMSTDELTRLTAEVFKGDSLRLLAILVEWDDRLGTHPRESFDTLLFSRDVLPEGSLADYFYEVSYGRVKLTGDVIDWYNAGPVYDKYFPFSSLFEPLDAIIDYSLYDGDKDNRVDAICFIRSGTGEEDSQNPLDIWSYASISSQGWGRYDGKQVSTWNTCPEMKPLRDPVNPMQFSGETIRSGIRVFCHEIGHNLGLPDLYDYDDKLNTATYDVIDDRNDHPLVDWCQMGYYGYGYLSIGTITANHYCGWSKIQLGFIEPIVLEGEYIDLVLYNVETIDDSSLYQIPINGSREEYFLLEYRNPQSSGKFDKFDSDFSCWFWPDLTFGYDVLDRGLLITHIDDEASSSDDWTAVNRGTPIYEHYTVIVEDAGYNRIRDVTHNPEGHVTDSAQWWYPWETRKGALFSSDVPDQDVFGPNTDPSSDGYDGYSGVFVRVDSIVDDRMYLYVNTSLNLVECCMLRGDADRSEQVDALDLDFLVNYFYRTGEPPECENEANVNDDEQVDILDLIYLIDFLFNSGPPPVDCPVGGMVPVFTSTPVTSAIYDQPYTYDANADGDPPPIYSLTTYPVGMSINASTGLIDWTPSDIGDYDVVIEATNLAGTAEQPFTISVAGVGPSFTSTPVLDALVGELYSYDADADGYPEATFSLLLYPTGMTIDPITGLVEWTPTGDGDFDVVIQASNSAGVDYQGYSISVTIPEAPLITSTPGTAVTVYDYYTYDVEATGHPAPTYTLTTFPTGMTIDQVTGLIEWTPEDLGDFDVVVEASNSSGTDIQPFTISVTAVAPVFTSTPVTTAVYDKQYSYDADASGDPAPTYALTTFPAGMTIDDEDGRIRWTPDDIGDFDVVVEATNPAGGDTQPFTITVSGVAPSITSTAVTTGTYGVLYSYDVEADGYPAATFSLTTYPTGMTIDPVTGLIEWMPDATGDFDVVVEATNAYGTDTQPYTITVQ